MNFFFFSVRTNHSGTLLGLIFVLVCPKNSAYVTALTQVPLCEVYEVNNWLWVIPCQIIQGMTPLPFRFVHFFTICKSCWNDQSVKISALNSLQFWSYWDLKIRPKWVFWGKICHFEFMFSGITIVLVILSSWSLVWVSFWGWEIQKSLLEVLRHLRFQVLILVTAAKKIKDKYLDKYKYWIYSIHNWKKKSSFSIDINLLLSQKWLLILF